MILDFLFDTFLAFADFFVMVLIGWFLRRWNRKQEWFGVVIKNKRRRARSPSKYRYTVVFRTEDGRRKRLRMGESYASSFKLGWRYRKRKGVDFPDPDSGMEFFG
jgi:hypothetical protein